MWYTLIQIKNRALPNTEISASQSHYSPILFKKEANDENFSHVQVLARYTESEIVRKIIWKQSSAEINTGRKTVHASNIIWKCMRGSAIQ